MSAVFKWLISFVLGCVTIAVIGFMLLAGARYPEVAFCSAILGVVLYIIDVIHEALWD